MPWTRADSGGLQAGTVPGSGVQGAGESAFRKSRLQPAHGCSIGLVGEGKSEIPAQK